jgi:hypothetical protein
LKEGQTGSGPEPFAISDALIDPGTRLRIEIPISNLMSGTPVSLPIVVLHGAAPGPAMWLTAAIHGDELCGIDIIRRVLEILNPKRMAGTVIAVPVVNVHGFNTGQRYLPDRRDLNRSFPGSPRGSLASRIAHILMSEVIARCSVGIDLHTGSDHRENLPQIRADLDDQNTLELAEVFGAPIAIQSRLRDGSMRQAATETGATVLLYEAGEAGRFSTRAIRAGSEGVLRVIEHLGIQEGISVPADDVRVSHRSTWVRASRSGIVHLETSLGAHVVIGETIALIRDPYGKTLGRIAARRSGVIIGVTHNPLVNRGDALVHIAETTE